MMVPVPDLLTEGKRGSRNKSVSLNIVPSVSSCWEIFLPSEFRSKWSEKLGLQEGREIAEAVSRRASVWQVQRPGWTQGTSSGNSSGAVTMETGAPQSQALATWRPV